eukprot:10090561-Heterocapsa_arctica.AAC.1
MGASLDAKTGSGRTGPPSARAILGDGLRDRGARVGTAVWDTELLAGIPSKGLPPNSSCLSNRPMSRVLWTA